MLKKRSAIESSESSDEDDDEVMEEEEDDSVVENEVEKNDLSSEDESDESDSDDDLPEETILRPEESKQEATMVGKNIEDHFENDDDDDSDDEELDQETQNAIDHNSDLMDMFSIHLDNELSPDLLECVHTTRVSNTHELDWKVLGRIIVDIPTATKVAEEEGPVKKTKQKSTGR